MILSIRHETVYRYSAPLTYTIQQLRLSPRIEAHQRVLSWHIAAPGQCHPFTDAFDNVSHMLTITDRHDEVKIQVTGVIEVTSPDRGRLLDKSGLSPLIFTVPTRLTEPGEPIAAFAARHLSRNAGSNQLLKLAEHIRGAVTYQSGATAVTSTASEALLLGQGVCQDHAQLFIACCHTQQIPARYVSGYIDPGSSNHAESHAWIDAWVEEKDFSGWVSIDVTHARFENDSYCRLAIGRDYDSAAPVRGVRRGGGDESMTVRVNVSAS